MTKKLNIRLLVLLAALLSTTLTWAVSTVDKLLLSDVTLSPGGDDETQYATLSVLSAVRKYAAFNVDIYLPEGVAPAYYEGELDVYEVEGGILPKASRNKYKHTLDVSYTESENRLRLICYASPSTEFNSEAGALYYIGLTASTYAKPGKKSVTFKKQNLTTVDETKYEPADASYDITIGSIAKADLSVSSANKWSTVILPFNVTTLPEGLKAYTCNSKDDDAKVFNLNEVTGIEAYTPYVLYSESGYTGTLTGEVEASQYPDGGAVTKGFLTGAIEAQTTNEGYILQKQGGAVKFYKADPTKTYTIPEGKCWATPDVSTADSYGFAIVPTAVEGVKANGTFPTAEYYDLTGRRTAEPRDGKVYITKGKKLLK